MKFTANHFIDHVLCQVLLPVGGVLHFHRRSLCILEVAKTVIIYNSYYGNCGIPGVHFVAALAPKTPQTVTPSLEVSRHD